MRKAKKDNNEIIVKEPPFESDKRVFERLNLKDVKVDFKDLRRGTKGRCACLDISGGGVTLECSDEIQPKAPLKIRFHLSDGLEPLQLLGKVSWSKLEGTLWRMGVSFDGARLMSLSHLLKSAPWNIKLDRISRMKSITFKKRVS